MSWFNETFGDSLTSLKGQITKITKEVLADDENPNSEEKEYYSLLVKELEALCESKDLEIASLRSEFSKAQAEFVREIELLKNDKKFMPICDISKNGEISDLDLQKFCQMDDELNKLREERNHLNTCLDELQSEHQAHLDHVMSMRDKCKEELEELKKKFSSVKLELKELKEEKMKSGQFSLGNNPFFEEQNEMYIFKIESLESEILELKKTAQEEKNEKEELVSSMRKKLEKEYELKHSLQKAAEQVHLLNENKLKAEESNKSIKLENDSLKNKINFLEIENGKIQAKLTSLMKDQEGNLKKDQNQENIELKLSGLIQYQKEIHQKLKEMLGKFQIKIEEDVNESTFIKLLGFVEEKWVCYQKDQEQIVDSVKQDSLNQMLELKKLKEEKLSLESELKNNSDKWAESEKKYQENIASLENVILEMKTQQQDCINQSQTDDVKRLEQEVAHLMSLVQAKNNEIMECSKKRSTLEQEMKVLKSLSGKTEQELLIISKEKDKLEEDLSLIKNKEFEMMKEKLQWEEKLKSLEPLKINLEQENNALKTKIDELEKQLVSVSISNDKSKALESELEKVTCSKVELENMYGALQKVNENSQKEYELLKAQIIIKETNLSELMKSNMVFQEEINKLQSQNNEIIIMEKEIKKWKDASVDLEIQRQDLIGKNEELETECMRLKSDLQLSALKDAELVQLKQTNTNLIESINKLHNELEGRIQVEQVIVTKESETESKYQKKLIQINELQEENNELKSRIQKFQEQMKLQMVNTQSPPGGLDIQQHRRTKSAVDFESVPIFEMQKQKIDSSELSEEVKLLKQALQHEQGKYRLLQNQFQEIAEKEASARKEFERLKQHLLEIEDHYTEEAVENEKVINDLKSKLIAAEEQLKNSSTLYTSVKVRDNQHLESLQSQIRLISAQRDDLQSKLSAAEDEVQKHKASLMSLQIVLEQFQQDKEREVEGIAMKYEKQMQLTHSRFRDLEMEIEELKKQLLEAKNGLKAASRLGEQLEKKTQQVSELEGSLTQLNEEVSKLESSLEAANQSNNGKIDKSLIKNLVVGYILSPKADRKSQVLRIMASVLDFNQEERDKLEVDSTNSGWLSNILHPKGGASSNQSLSEAFIRFLEYESRPQPQLKLIPEQYEANKARPSSTSPKPSGVFSELMLPTFNSSQENESSIILKNVLKDS